MEHKMDLGFCATCKMDAWEIWPETTLRVEFMDGVVQEFKNVRFLAAQGHSDPIKVNGTTLEFEKESDTQVIYLLGVRRYEMIHN